MTTVDAPEAAFEQTACGGFSDIAKVREFGHLDPSAVPEDNPSIKLPTWLTRTGRTLFEVDTGFGILKGRAVLIDDEALQAILGDEKDAPWPAITGAIVDYPNNWKFETAVEEQGFKFEADEALPGVSTVRKYDAKRARLFCIHGLTIGVLQQLAIALRYAQLPAIPYTATAAPSS